MKQEVKANGVKHTLVIQDTGAPRGEKNYWTVELNGHTVYSGYNGREARGIHGAIERALQDAE